MTYSGTHYTQTPEQAVSKWMSEVMTPSDPIRQRHRVEFYAHILANAYLTEEAEAAFAATTRGKLNCRNGVLDITTGRIEPHSPDYGFKYMLPHDYHPDASSEFFMDWLAEICLKRDEVVEACIDMMAYCLWPTYDDHVFAVMVGEGANGKSTLLHIIQSLVGRNNYSAVSLTQLSTNKFMAAELEGKLVNIAGEASGRELGYEQINIIKALSAGDEIVIERKNQQPYMAHNTAKLFFAANKVPQFAEKDTAIRRRLLVLPFDYTIKNTDSNIEKKLLSEVPGILSMLVRHTQRKIATDGRFSVTRNGEAIMRAQDKFLLEGNSASQWAEECMIVTNKSEHFIAIEQAFAHYQQWAVASGHKHVMTKNNFSNVLANQILKRQTTLKRLNSKVIRGHAGIQISLDN
jgi:putative DNA primase/helicase